MVAVSECALSAPVAGRAAGRAAVPVPERRFVAVAVSAMELLRPESDLVRLIEGVGQVDLLLASEDLPASGPAAIGVLEGCQVDGDLTICDDDDADDELDEVCDGAERLGLPGLRLHRLGLAAPLGPLAEDDLVAALSELVGFDPEPGVYCLGPVVAAADPARAVVDRAAARIAQVYGIPLLRYQCLELSVVGGEADDS